MMKVYVYILIHSKIHILNNIYINNKYKNQN